MKNKNEGNENKIKLGGFNCTVDKMEKDGRNKTLYKCLFQKSLSKLIVDNRLDDIWSRRTQILLSLSTTIDLLAQDLL